MFVIDRNVFIYIFDADSNTWILCIGQWQITRTNSGEEHRVSFLKFWNLKKRTSAFISGEVL